jgi:hypothetical protein
MKRGHVIAVRHDASANGLATKPTGEGFRALSRPPGLICGSDRTRLTSPLQNYHKPPTDHDPARLAERPVQDSWKVMVRWDL